MLSMCVCNCICFCCCRCITFFLFGFLLASGHEFNASSRCIHTSICMYVYIQKEHMFTYIRIHIYRYRNVQMYICIHIHTYVYYIVQVLLLLPLPLVRCILSLGFVVVAFYVVPFQRSSQQSIIKLIVCASLSHTQRTNTLAHMDTEAARLSDCVSVSVSEWKRERASVHMFAILFLFPWGRPNYATATTTKSATRCHKNLQKFNTPHFVYFNLCSLFGFLLSVSVLVSVLVSAAALLLPPLHLLPPARCPETAMCRAWATKFMRPAILPFCHLH